MSDLQKRETKLPMTARRPGKPRLLPWVLGVVAFLGLGVLIMLLMPWVFPLVGVLVGAWLVWRIARWWRRARDEPERSVPQMIDANGAQDELDAQIALEDLRERMHHRDR